ncbi:MAG: hypothetical protein HRU14_05560 [Planctomycetes bacterium]|nr:hypothetical protein [Planctomycetota bacterium]
MWSDYDRSKFGVCEVTAQHWETIMNQNNAVLCEVTQTALLIGIVLLAFL